MPKIDVPALVLESLKDVLADVDEENKVDVDSVDESTRLIGKEAVLTSIALVSMIVDVEQKLADDHDVFVTIADERAMSQEKSPFRSVDTLSQYISMLIDEQR